MGKKYYKAINKYYTPTKYFIGVDLGLEYTSISRFSEKNGECMSHVFRVQTGFLRNNGNDTLLESSDCILAKSQFFRNFLALPSYLTQERKDAFNIFFKLIVTKILEGDPELQYNSATGEANFKICITYPFSWEICRFNFADEYKRFIQEQYSLLPIVCISTDLAINSFYKNKYNALDSHPHLILNIGSSSCDFTPFSNYSRICECCTSHNVTFYYVIDAIVNYGYTKSDNSEENIANMRYVENQREILHLGSAESEIYQAVSYELDRYLSHLGPGHCCPFIVDVRFRELIPNTETETKIAFSIFIEYSEIIKIISEYMECLRKALMNGMRQLQSYGISPKRIFLVGDAIKYKIISNMIKDEFPEQIVYIPNYLDYVISDGAALFLHRLDNKLETKR